MDGNRPPFGATNYTGAGTEPTQVQDLSELQPGMMVGEYQIEGPLGQGGMGRVYAATHPVIAKRAAVKVLHPELSVNREAVERFVQEARSVNQIGHPNIVDIFAFGTLPDGRNYFVMEWLRGESLRDRIRREQLPLTEALAIADTVTVALEAAHEKGIVHRDLKPDNVFLCAIKGKPPQVKLLDFGIAKLTGAGTIHKTQTGNMLGTPAYVSPEQARAQHVDHRTDIYALGVMLYELVTGRLPFVADNAADMIAKHLFETPQPMIEVHPHVPPQLDALVMAMLAKDPAHRPTLEQVRAQLATCLHFVPAGAMSNLRVHAPAGMYTPTAAPPYGTNQKPQPAGMYITPGMSATATPASPTAAPAKKSRALWIVLAFVVVGGITVGAIVASQHGSTSAHEAAPAPAPAPAPVPAPATATVPTPAPAAVPDPVPVPVPAPATTTPTPTKPTPTSTPHHTTHKPPPPKGSGATPPPDDRDAPM